MGCFRRSRGEYDSSIGTGKKQVDCNRSSTIDPVILFQDDYRDISYRYVECVITLTGTAGKQVTVARDICFHGGFRSLRKPHALRISELHNGIRGE